MKGDINFNFNINKKSALFILGICSIFTMANYVSIVDADTSGGITVVNEVITSPVGSIVMWPSSDIPKGWLEINGQSIAAYPKLADIVGSSTLPDFRGQFVRAWDNGAGIDNGRALMSLQSDAIRNITGQAYMNATSSAVGHEDIGALSAEIAQTSNRYSYGGGTYYGANVHFDASKSVPTANENRPKNISVVYIIRAE